MKKKKRQKNTGFSVVELIVIISLFAIMSSVVSFDFQRYQDNIERINLATDVALAFRQMQVFGTSSANRIIGGAGFDQDSGTVQTLVDTGLLNSVSLYGVEFDIENQVMTLFQEIGTNNNSYNDGVDLLIDRLVITGVNRVLHVCATNGFNPPVVDAAGNCEFPSAGIQAEEGTFTAMFRRPFPDASYTLSVEPGLEPGILIMVVGIPGDPAEELNYIYFDAVGLIQGVGYEVVS